MFKDKLKELREKEELSQQALADKLFVSRSAIAKWENGNGIPSDVNLESICKFFDVDEEWLLDRKDMKDVVEKLDNKNNKVLWFVLGIVTPLLLIILSLLAFFVWKCEGICPAIYIPPKGIFFILAEENYGFIVLIAMLIYIYQLSFSFFFQKFTIKNGKLIQIINLCLSIVCYIVTFIIAYNLALNNNHVLFFL